MSLFKELSKEGCQNSLLQLARMWGRHAGTLASQILYYAQYPDSYLWRDKDGYRWVAMTRPELFFATGLTEATYRKALSILEPLGVIYRTSGHRSGLRVTYLRIDAERLTELVIASELAAEGVSNGENNHTGSDKKTNLLILQECFKDKDLAVPAKDTPPVETLTAATGVETVATIQDILKQPKTIAAKPVVINPTYLCMLWKKRMGDITESFIKEPTVKDKGQLSQYLKKVGPQAALEGLEYAFAHWVKFAWAAREAKGLSSVPSTPVIGFLLSHHDILLQLIAAEKAESASWVSPSPDKSSTMPVVPTEKPQETLTDFQKMVQKLKDKKA